MYKLELGTLRLYQIYLFTSDTEQLRWKQSIPFYDVYFLAMSSPKVIITKRWIYIIILKVTFNSCSKMAHPAFSLPSDFLFQLGNFHRFCKRKPVMPCFHTSAGFTGESLKVKNNSFVFRFIGYYPFSKNDHPDCIEIKTEMFSYPGTKTAWKVR